MRRQDIPNLITIARIILVLPVVLLLLDENYLGALILFFIAGVSDAVDGYLAKQYGWSSRLGTILDPLADKLLLVCSYAALAWIDQLPVMLLVFVLARDFIIVAGALAYHKFIGQYEMEPTWISKINTFFQILLPLVILFHNGVWSLDWDLIKYMIYIVFFTTVLSGIDYVLIWGRRAYNECRKN